MPAALRTTIPMVIRSQRHLLVEAGKVLAYGAQAPIELPISAEGVTYDMAQSAAWVDEEHFAVGRWDGSLTVFRFSESKVRGPLIAVAASSPSSEGVQMITRVAPRTIATSNDEQSIAVWRTNPAWNGMDRLAQLPFDLQYGAANSGEAFLYGDGVCMVVGHANGFVTVWMGEQDGSDFALTEVIDARSDRPKNPWNMHNVRGLAAIEVEGAVRCVLSGSEDGDMCAISVPDGRLLSRTTYNENAQRGINAMAVAGTDILVANCSVGAEDRNLWFFTIDPVTWTITSHDAKNLMVNANATQVFNFTVVWGEYHGGRCFFASTQEGALWMGTVREKTLTLIGYQEFPAHLGAALAYASNGNLALAAYDLYEFKTLAQEAKTFSTNPQRLRPSRGSQPGTRSLEER